MHAVYGALHPIIIRKIEHREIFRGDFDRENFLEHNFQLSNFYLDMPLCGITRKKDTF